MVVMGNMCYVTPSKKLKIKDKERTTTNDIYLFSKYEKHSKIPIFRMPSTSLRYHNGPYFSFLKMLELTWVPLKFQYSLILCICLFFTVALWEMLILMKPKYFNRSLHTVSWLKETFLSTKKIKNINRHNGLHPLQPQYCKNAEPSKQNTKKIRAFITSIKTAF